MSGMGAKDFVHLFNQEIEKIIAGGPLSLPNEEVAEEDQELLTLAKLLHEADFSKDSRLHIEDIFSKNNTNTELGDDELDLVAGGRSINAVEANHDKGKI